MVLSADMLKYKSSKCEVGKTYNRLSYRGRAKRPYRPCFFNEHSAVDTHVDDVGNYRLRALTRIAVRFAI